jgi:hypothetical protein
MGRGNSAVQASQTLGWQRFGPRGQGSRGRFALAEPIPSTQARAYASALIARAATDDWQPVAEVLRGYRQLVTRRPLLEQIHRALVTALEREQWAARYSTIEQLGYSLGLANLRSTECIAAGPEGQLHLIADPGSAINISYLREQQPMIATVCEQSLPSQEVSSQSPTAWQRYPDRRCLGCAQQAQRYADTQLTELPSVLNDDERLLISARIEQHLAQAWPTLVSIDQLPALARRGLADAVSEIFAARALRDPERTLRQAFSTPAEWQELIDALKRDVPDVLHSLAEGQLFQVLTAEDWAGVAQQYLLTYGDDEPEGPQEPVDPEPQYVSETLYVFLLDRLGAYSTVHDAA